MSDNRLHEQLRRLVAESMIQTQRMRAFHWFVQGPAFFRLHEIFEAEYTRWAEATDAVAERLLAIGGAPPQSLAAALELAGRAEGPLPADPAGMVRESRESLQRLSGLVGEAIASAEGAGDRASTNLLDEILDASEKQAWMLAAYLEEAPAAV